VITTDAPASASAVTVVRPNPLVAPVAIATQPSEAEPV
jgi:hypothetical protein